jgi:hypothetical protein
MAMVYGVLTHVILSHPHTINLMLGFIREMEIWNLAQVMTWQLCQNALILCGATVMAGLLFLPLRDTPNGFQQLKRADLLRLAWLLAIVTASLYAGLAVLSPQSLIFSFPIIRFPGFAPFGWLMATCACFGMALLARDMLSLGTVMVRQFCNGVLYVSLLLPFWAIAFALSAVSPPVARLMWIVTVCCSAAFLSELGVFRRLASEWSVYDEQLQYVCILGRSAFLSHSVGLASFGKERHLALVIRYGFFNLFVPAMFLWLLSDSWFAHANAHFPAGFSVWVANFTSESALLHGTTRTTQDILSDWVRHLEARSLVSFYGFGWLMMLISLSLTIYQLALKGLRGSSTDMQFLQTTRLMEIVQALDVPAWYQSLRARVARSVAELPEDQPCVTSMGRRIPAMRRTCQVVEYAARLNCASARTETMLAWILECEKSSGGFAAVPTIEADLLHTVSALRLLRHIDRQSQFPVCAHERWLKCVLVKCLRDGRVLSKSEWLENVRLCLDGLAAIGGQCAPRARLRNFIVRRSVTRWQQSKFSVRDTRNLLCILDHLKVPEYTTRERIRQVWLPPFERHLPLLKPDSTLAEIADLVWILRSLYPGGFQLRLGVIQALDNVNKLLQRDPFIEPHIQSLSA